MRKMFAAVVLLAVTSAHAAEELKFGDLNYFLKQGQFNVAADISSTYYKQTPAGAATLETRGYLVESRYGYGITDKFNAFIGVDYAFDREVEDKSPAGSNNGNFDQNGFANPALGLNYRLLNQNNSRYNLDFGFVGRFNIEEAKTGSATGQNIRNGNFADGRSSYEANVRTGRKWNEANEWQLAAGTVYYRADGERKLLLNTGDQKLDLDSSMNFFLSATYQYRPVNEFMMSVSARATRVGEADFKNKTAGTNSTEKAHTDLNFVYRAKYLITDNFIANFHYGMSRNAEYNVETNGANQKIQRRRENYFGLGVEFLF